MTVLAENCCCGGGKRLRVVWDEATCRLIVRCQPPASVPGQHEHDRVDTGVVTESKLEPSAKLMRRHTLEDISGGCTDGVGLKQQLVHPSVVQSTEACSALLAPPVYKDFGAVLDPAAALQKARDRAETANVMILNVSRPGKKCLVLDIDGTVYDPISSRPGSSGLEYGTPRPHLHTFLTRCYEHYDICIWSATMMLFVEDKMREMGCLRHPNYKICCLIDNTAMVPVRADAMKLEGKYCKPLAFVWGKFLQYHADNTVMLDDKSSAFIMNTQHGLLVRQYSNSKYRSVFCEKLCTTCDQCKKGDPELQRLAEYLCLIARLDTFAGLNHRNWEEYLKQHAPGCELQGAEHTVKGDGEHRDQQTMGQTAEQSAGHGSELPGTDRG